MKKDGHPPACDGGGYGEAEQLLEFDGQDGQFSGGIVQDMLRPLGTTMLVGASLSRR